MLRIVFLIVFSSVFEVHAVIRALAVEIRGIGLTLVDDTLPYKQKYSYTFKEPGELNLNCRAGWGLIGNYELILQNEQNIGTRHTLAWSRNSSEGHTLSYLFKLTPESRIISCTAKDLFSNSTRFTSTVDLKYEPDPTTAPSIDPTTKTTASVPIEPTAGSAEPQTPATTKPTASVPIEPTAGSAESQTPGDSFKNIVIACLCFVIVVGFIFVIIRNRCSRTQVNLNKMAENNMPSEIEEVYSHGAGLRRPRRQRAPGPQHPQ